MSFRRTAALLPLAVALLPACAPSVQTVAPAVDARGRFLRDTLVIAAPANGLYAGTTMRLSAEVWRSGEAVPDSQADVHWTVRDVRHGWIAENGTLVLLTGGTLTVVAESGVLQSVQELEIEENPVAHVEIVPDATTRVAVGDTSRFVARPMTESHMALPDARVHYTVASRGLGPDAGAVIDDAGRFVARRPGIYTVMAVVGTVASQAIVIVPAPRDKSWPESMDELEIAELPFQPYVGTYGVMRAEGRAALRNDVREVAAVRWSSDDTTVARITSDGTVAFVGDGRVTIAAEVGGARAERNLNVRRDAAARLTFRVGEHDIHVGDEVPLGEQIWQRGGMPIRDARVNYGIVSHTDHPSPNAVEITEAGVFIARVPGVYTIIAEFGGIADQATVVVRSRESVARIGAGNR
jgi:hypothetical protein